MVRYDDIIKAEEGQRLLEEKHAEEKANSIINAELFKVEQELKDEETMDILEQIELVAQDAASMIQQGQDPNAILSVLPPEVQNRVGELLNGNSIQDQNTFEQPSQNVPPDMVQKSTIPSITDAAKQLAMS